MSDEVQTPAPGDEQRQRRIEHHRNYCVHYHVPRGCQKECKAGMDIENIMSVPAGEKGIAWGPCISGHTLADPTAHCPKWERRSMEAAEQYADAVEASMRRMTIISPVVSAWRNRPPIGKAEVIECPVCKGRLHLRQSSHNGHVHGRCETQGCVAWME